MSVDVNMFWHGPKLGAVHAACVRSFIRNGHTVIMHCYDRPNDLPEGTRVFDAAKIMPFEELHPHHETGSVSLGTNRYRYRLIAEGHGLYSDCDMFCLRPITDGRYVFGKEQNNIVNGALLKFPVDSDLAAALIEATRDYYFIPPWFRPSKKRRLSILKKLGSGAHVGQHPWGVWGPQLISYYVDKLNLMSEVAPIDRYYPVHPWQTTLLSDPGLSIADLATPRSETIHLWHKFLSREDPPRGSPLWEIINC
ncbi:MAG: galactosyltransferase Lgt5 [Gammaproteobacteria bacterium]|nr:galactosyltransferase Lgt5 [Gammaproteobacteria bacterium]